MKVYKGFNKDLTCRRFQFKEGETLKPDAWYKLVDGEFVEAEP